MDWRWTMSKDQVPSSLISVPAARMGSGTLRDSIGVALDMPVGSFPTVRAVLGLCVVYRSARGHREVQQKRSPSYCRVLPQ